MIKIMAKCNPEHEGIENLLNLHRETIAVGKGWWVTIRATKHSPSDGRPHGIKYSLTLHNSKDHRVLGYDNAHDAVQMSGPSRRKRKPSFYDHIHYRDKRVKAYNFVSAGKLLEDFWADVEEILIEEGVI